MAAKKKHVVRKIVAKEREPEFMVQINDPATMRKDVLESLKEVILFMQGYEQLRKVQEEKMALFMKLKGDVRDLNLLIETKLRRNFPRGKFKPTPREEIHEESHEEETVASVSTVSAPVAVAPRVVNAPAKKEAVPEPPSELDELEAQLREIESQLNGLK